MWSNGTLDDSAVKPLNTIDPGLVGACSAICHDLLVSIFDSVTCTCTCSGQ